MLKYYFTIIMVFVLFHAKSQNIYSDSIYYENGSFETVLVSKINHKNQLVSIKEKIENLKMDINFQEISAVSLSNGKYYVKKLIHGKPELLVSFIRGNYSLLFDDHKGIFYIENRDSLLFISKYHIGRALPVVFGKEIMNSFYTIYGKNESYSYQYFSKVITYVNAINNDVQEPNDQNIDQFSTKFSFGPSLEFTSSQLWLQLIKDVHKDPAYARTQTYHNKFAPLGINFSASITSRWHIQLSAYYYQMLLKDFTYEWGSYETIDIPFTAQKKYDPIPRASNYSFFSYNTDLSLRYLLVRPGKRKLQPYLFAGPSICVLKDHQMKISILYRDANQFSSCDFWYKSHTKELMVALNCGVGLNYVVGERFILNAFGKFQGGVYPKALLTSDVVKRQNTSPYDHSHFDKLNLVIHYRYDQISRLVSAGGSVQFRF